jgi:hypothetical protein
VYCAAQLKEARPIEGEAQLGVLLSTWWMIEVFLWFANCS